MGLGGSGGLHGGGKRAVDKLVEDLDIFKAIGDKPTPGTIERVLRGEPPEKVVAKLPAVTEKLSPAIDPDEEETEILLILWGIV
jgi:hypothetical protein